MQLCIKVFVYCLYNCPICGQCRGKSGGVANRVVEPCTRYRMDGSKRQDPSEHVAALTWAANTRIY